MDECRTGYLLAVEELRATAEHWQAYEYPQGGRVHPMILAALREIADTIEAGWLCHESTHTAPRCLARAVELEMNG